ncbi:hypothetical protein HQ621_27770, partial [Pseudomonas simiae]|uniref:LamG-like jellyroll fold domain-containing protein n=1 Tax=Pseudomonas simiae TaxID=321846 RepID=UPI00159449CA
MASTYLSRVHGSSTNTKQWTVSVWLKRAKIGYQCSIWGTGNSSGYYTTFLMFSSDDTLRWGNLGGSSMEGELITNRKFRDTNAWYHIVVGVDTDQTTASNRVKIYVNGVQETSFSTNNQPSQGQGLRWNEATSTSYPSIGRTGAWDDRYFEGCMSHIHLIDGTQYDASAFGETDSTTGEWKIKTSPSVNYGTNGAFVLKDGNSGTDQSSNTNNWTVNGTLTKTEDSPSNVFAVLDTNNITLQGTSTYACGGTKFKNSSASWGSAISTLMPTSGKWYFESQVTDNDGQKFMMGICDMDKYPEWRWQSHPYFGYRGYSYYGDGKYLGTNSSGTTNSDLDTSLTQTNNNDYIGMAVDLDNNKLYTHINGT